MRANSSTSSFLRWTAAALLLLAISSPSAAATDLKVTGACKPAIDPTVKDVASAITNSRKTLNTTIDLSANEYHALQTCKDSRKVTLTLKPSMTGLSAVIYRIGQDDKLTRCERLYFGSAALEVSVDRLRCTADAELKKHRAKGGLLAVTDGATVVPVARLEYHAKAPVIAGDDIGVALNILNRAGDGDGFRFFEGASAYYSLSSLDSNAFRVIANLSVLDFDPEVDFETGLALGLLYKPPGATRKETGNGFALSLAYGYNFMADDSADGWFTLIGFGWNFQQTPD